MSTKSTIDHNWPHAPAPGGRSDPALPAFHLYSECFEPDAVYLRADVEFDADNVGVTLRLPVTLWNRLVAHGPRPLPQGKEGTP